MTKTKYKKLDNLDDLRVGDVIVVPGINDQEIIRIDGEIIFTMSGEIRKTFVYNMQEVKGWGDRVSAKHPLPEKKEKVEKKWIPEKGEGYYFPLITPHEKTLIDCYYWAGDPVDKLTLERGLAFKTPEEAREAALKMIKAINPNYNE